MKTLFLLMTQYEGRAIIPLDRVCQDYFSHLSTEMFQRKALSGALPIPIVRMEPSQKSAKGVHLEDLATYLDAQRQQAIRERDQLTGDRRVGRAR
ncbi:pyocin activator PrtN family protein [Pseudomonas benzenivorans]|uniref:Pyocin activator PrtN family protein n=1 Tax=Pseudomonas benzenivorans TaxID=556533 RepID=A0ABY5H7L1_9PSED|nr:pyocin activator PrtN family protein [Pseudomonas benzenivorans]UTW08245.1 pyocin activator PrtN family protein [Pseudomonas benzenivorans]